MRSLSSTALNTSLMCLLVAGCWSGILPPQQSFSEAVHTHETSALPHTTSDTDTALDHRDLLGATRQLQQQQPAYDDAIHALMFLQEIQNRQEEARQLQEEADVATARRALLIDNGAPSTTAMYPWIAMVVRPGSENYLCGGTLIHPRVVLTAAHCVIEELEGSRDPVVHVGKDGNGQHSGYRSVKSKSVAHPKFAPGSFDYDIAALILEEPLDDHPSATLVSEGATLGTKSKRSSDSDLVVLGWGATHRNELARWLYSAEVSPVDHDKCKQLFQPFGSEVTQQMTCVTGRTCAGDSGGPLFLLPNGKPSDSSSITAPIRGSHIGASGLPGAAQVDAAEAILVGQVSFGFPRDKGKGCPAPNPATVFTDLSAPELQQWINKDILQNAVKNGVDSVREPDHNWQDTSLPPALEQVQAQHAPSLDDNGLGQVLWDVGPFSWMRRDRERLIG